MHNLADHARMDRVVAHVREQAQLQGKIQLEQEQSDIARIISVTASVVPDEVQLLTDTLEFSGRLIFEVLYVSVDAPDDVNVLQAQSHFHHSIHAPGVQSGMYTRYTIEADDVEEMLESPRSIALTTDVEFNVWVFETGETEQLHGAEGLQLKSEAVTALETLERQTQIIDVAQQVQLPLRALPVGKILSSDGFALVRDVTGTVEGTHVDAELMVFMTYYTPQTENADAQFQSASFTVPFGFDLTWEQRGMGENAYVVLAEEDLQLTAAADEMGEMRLIDVEARILASASLWQETELELPVDAYLPGHAVETTQQNVQLCTGMQEKSAQRMHRFSIALPTGYPAMEQVLFMRVHPVVRECIDDRDGMLVVGTLLCSIVYCAEGKEHPIYGFHAAIPFEERVALSCGAENVLVYARCLQATAGVLDETQADCRVQLEVCAVGLQTRDVTYISHVQDLGVKTEESAIVMSIVTQNDDLWSIAKRFNVSMDTLLAANPKYETRMPAAGDKVLLYRRIVEG